MEQASQSQLRELLQKVDLTPKLSGAHRDNPEKDTSFMKYQAEVQRNSKLQFEVPCKVQDLFTTTTHNKVNLEYNFLAALTNNAPEVHERLVQDDKYSELNRYCDILVYDETRVKLQRNEDTDYINACFVDSPLGNDRKLIATQGPKPNTIKHFWRMIAQENVTLIVTTCNLIEKGTRKCEQFWPEQDEIKGLDSGFSIQKTGQQQLSPHLIERTFTLNDQHYQRKDFQVKQLHYVGWPDHDVPNGDAMTSFSLMLGQFIQWLLLSKPEEKAIVHCSAGIGRTGTTICLANAIVNIWAQLNKGEKEPRVSIFSIVRRLREQRFGLVQMPNQYAFIYQFLMQYLASEKIANP